MTIRELLSMFKSPSVVFDLSIKRGDNYFRVLSGVSKAEVLNSQYSECESDISTTGAALVSLVEILDKYTHPVWVTAYPPVAPMLSLEQINALFAANGYNIDSYAAVTDLMQQAYALGKASEATMKSLIAAQESYIALLGESIKDSAPFLHVHGYKDRPEQIDRGAELRLQIAELKSKLGLS